MASRVFCVTIDTEPDCGINWKRSSPLSFESVTSGIPGILRPIWDRHGIMPVYFVSPEVVLNDQCCEVLRREIEFGAELAAHLHSEYIEPERRYEKSAGTLSDEYPCYAYNTETELAKIRNLTEVITERIGVKPVSYRAARYGADLDTVRCLESLDYKVDSSITPEIDWSSQGGPDHSRAPKQPYFVSKNDYYSAGDTKILEVPITISKRRLPLLPDKWFCYRWLRPSHMTVIEMKILAKEFVKEYNSPVLNAMFHSMEVIPQASPYVRSKTGQKMFLERVDRVLSYLTRLGFQSRTLKDIYEVYYGGTRTI